MPAHPRNSLSQTDKYLGFANAYATIRAHSEAGRWLSAYVVAFSVFEDRLNAARMIAADLAGAARPVKHDNHYKKVNCLERNGHLDPRTASDWRAAGDRRNALIHAAMWAVGAVGERDVKKTVQLARAADALAKRLKRKLASAAVR